MATIKGKEIIDGSVTNNKLEDSTQDFLGTLSSNNGDYHSDINISTYIIETRGNIIANGSVSTGGKKSEHDAIEGIIISDRGRIFLCGDPNYDESLKLSFIDLYGSSECGINAFIDATNNNNYINIYNADLSVGGTRVPRLNQTVVSVGVSDWTEISSSVSPISMVRYDSVRMGMNISASSLLILRRGSGYVTEQPDWIFEAIATGENSFTRIGKSLISSNLHPNSSITFVLYSIT